MPILGIDLGSSTSVVATVGRGGVAIIRNDLADRLTPTLVSYTDTERLTGDVALARWKSNATRTCRGFMNLLGIPSDEDFKNLIELENGFSLVRLGTSKLGNGLIGYDLENSSYGVQSATQVLGCYLKRLKELGNNYFGSNSIHGVVIGVPSWLTDSSRQAVLDACALADLNCLKVFNTGSAIALDYGLFRSHNFEAGNPQYVSFVDIGYSSACVTIVEYQPSQLQILSVHQDLTLGGRTLDKIITERCVEVLKPTQELSCKARLRLEESSEKIKKVLSANRESSINLECLIGDSDFEFTLTRDEFEQITEDYQEKLRALLKKAKSSLQSDKVFTVEICGGVTRIPFVQSLIEKVFERNLSKTLSSDECVARGAAIQAAMLDPHHRVKEFTVIDRRFTPVFIVLNHNGFLIANESSSVESGEVAKDETFTLFEAGTPNYFVKWLTFPNILPPGKVMSIYTLMDAKKITLGEVILSEIDAADIKDTSRIKMRFMNDIHGIVRVEALLVTDRQVQEPFFEAETYTDEQGAEATRTIEKTRTKVLCDKKQLNIELVRPRGWLAKDEINLIYNQELKMAANDQSTINARNMLNQILANCFQYRIDMTNEKPDSAAIYASEEEREQIIKITHEVEQWIELNQELSVDEYQPVLQKLQTVWEPVYSRKVAADKLREEAEAKARAEAQAEAEAADSRAAKATEESKAMKSPASCETDEQSITADEQI